jgi:aminobenzoyl-glutamate utilization protein B
MRKVGFLCILLLSQPTLLSAQGLSAAMGGGVLTRDLMDDVVAEVEAMAKFTQVMVDKIFSFGELGFQEFETSRYIVSVLRENGFEAEEGIAGIPTAWFARWGSGDPVIAFGSDIDGIPKTSQKPGVAYHDPIVEGAPGHGEGHNSGQAVNVTAHNSGQAVNVTAALALKKVMEREGLTGTLVLWPGVAEELVATKAYFVRDGYFTDIDAVIFTHVSSNLSVAWGTGTGTGLVSVEFTFDGQSAHGAGAPWRGRSSLDAVELMNVGWNYRREHLRPLQRSHYVVSDGGDQPNVVPSKASVWYYFREITYPEIKKNFDTGVRIAQGAALMTDTEMSYRILGSAWPRHFNKVIAETMYEHIKQVGLPEWTEADQALARAVQREMGSEETGLDTELDELGVPLESPRSGGSDDIGDISWAVPTVTLRFPSNMPGLPGHHWSNAITMATPIAHKGATAGAKVVAMTALDLFTKPNLVEEAWKYYREVQTKDMQYTPLISADDVPATHLNEGIMAEFKAEMEKYYYDETRYDSYLEQLGITYPTLRP